MKKRREKDEVYTEDGNYIKIKKRITVNITKVESDDDKKPAALT
jgi:hypothetical protein